METSGEGDRPKADEEKSGAMERQGELPEVEAEETGQPPEAEWTEATVEDAVATESVQEREEIESMEAKAMETGSAAAQMEAETLKRANDIVKNHMLWSMGAGLVPIPIVDLAALTGLQLNMVRLLSNLYDIPFSKDAGKSIIASLVGSVVPVSLTPTLYSLIKAIPLIGQTAGAVTMSLAGGAATYAIGKVFVQHFESGGTFLDLNPEEVKGYFAKKYEEGQKVASDLKGSK